MPGPMTIVTLVDDDGDEFPIVLPGVYENNAGPDAEAALQIAAEYVEAGTIAPNGQLVFNGIEYQ